MPQESQKHSVWERAGFSPEEHTKFQRDFSKAGGVSIDEFLGSCQDSKMVRLGKTAIADALLPDEDMNSLFSSRADQAQIGRASNWYETLFTMIRQGVAFEDLDLEWLSVVTFNYDRSFEQFMFDSLKYSYQIADDSDVVKKIEQLEIIHVHGSLGKLEWQSLPNGLSVIPYHAQPTRRPRFPTDFGIQAGKNIQIIAESDQTSREFNTAHDLMQTASQVLFLGFGFHELSLKRLGVQKLKSGHLFGTIFEITYDTLKLLAEQAPLSNVSSASGQLQGIHGFERKKVYEFLQNHVSFRD